MKIFRYVLCSLVMAIFGLPGARAQVLTFQNPTFTGAGARAMAMGGAFIGLADDATAIYWNPGGLTQLKKPEVSLMGSYSSTQLEITGVTDIEPQTSITINFASIVLPLNAGGNNLVFGIGRVRALDFGFVSADLGGDAVFKGGLNNTMISAAYEVGSVVSFGLTGRMMDGGITYKNDNVNHPTFIDGEGVTKITGKSFLTYGILAKVGPKARLGAFFRQPMIFFETGVSGVFEGLAETRYEYPGAWGFGGSIRIGDNFTFSTDMTMTRWEALDEDDVDLPTIRAGAEYLLGGKGLPLPVRVGLFTEPLNYEDANDDDVKTKWLTFGVGLLGATTQMDLALMMGKTVEAATPTVVITEKVLKVIGSLLLKFK